MENTKESSPFVTWSLWGHRDWVVLVHTSVFWGCISAFGVTDVLQQEYGETKMSRRHPVPEDLYVMTMYYTLSAKQRKQRRSFVAQYRYYTYLRGGKSTRERRDDCLQHSTACTRVYTIWPIYKLLGAARMWLTRGRSISKGRQNKLQRTQNKKTWPLVSILSLAIYVVAHIIG